MTVRGKPTGEAQQRVNYMVRDFHPNTKSILNPYRAVVPIGDYS